MCANSENHDRFLSLFTALIESSFRHTTEHVTREIICLRFVVLSETVENKIISHFWFCLPSPENHSGHPMEYTVCLLMLHCLTAHALLFVVFYMKQKHKLITVCPSVLSKRAIASFFCFQVEACCERAITFIPRIMWRVTNYDWLSKPLQSFAYLQRGFLFPKSPFLPLLTFNPCRLLKLQLLFSFPCLLDKLLTALQRVMPQSPIGLKPSTNASCDELTTA